MPRYENKYLIGDLGTIVSLDRLVRCVSKKGVEFFKPKKRCIINYSKKINGAGYYSVCFGDGKTFQVHRIIAQLFIPNKNNYSQVNHKDGNKLNNKRSNLEWVTPSQNIKHAFKLGLIKQQRDKLGRFSAPIISVEDSRSP